MEVKKDWTQATFKFPTGKRDRSTNNKPLASNKNPSAEHLAGGLLFRMQRSDTQEAAWVLTSKPWQGDFISHGDWIDGERDASM